MNEFSEYLPKSAQSDNEFAQFLPKENTFGQKAAEFLTGGHVSFGKEPQPEVSFTSEGQMSRADVPTGDPGVFGDPVTWGVMAAYKPVQMVGSTVANKALAAGREFVGWMTGGASEVPSLVKAGAKGVSKAISSKPLAEAAAKRQEKGVLESITPEAKINEFAEFLPKAGEAAPKVAGGLESLAKEENLAAQRGSIQLGKKQKSNVPFDDPAVEERFKASSGLSDLPIQERVKNAVTDVWNKFSRSYENLPNTKEFAQLQFDLKFLEKQKEVAKDGTIKAIGEITSGLDKNTYDIFRRKVIVDDLMTSVDKGHDLPFGFTPETLTAEKQKFDSLTANNPKIQEALAKRKAVWDGLRQEYTEAMERVGFDVSDKLKNEDYFRHQVLEYVRIKGIFGSGEKLKTPTGRSFLKERKGSAKDINADYVQAEYQVMAQMKHDIQTAKIIENVEKNYSIADKVKLDAKAQGIDDWRKAIPEGYTVWQPREGNAFYLADSVPAKLADDIRSGMVSEIVGEDLKKVLAIGGKRKEFVVKEEVAKTLDEIVRNKQQGAFLEADKKILGAWKQWQLIQPRRWFKYNARNLSGDAEAAFVGNPSTFSKTHIAVKELWDVFKNKKQMSPEMQEWFNRGGMSSTLQAQEMGELNKLWVFSRFYEKSGKDIPKAAWNKYWNAARLSTDAREAVLRYSAYLDYLGQMKANNGVPKNFGASRPEEIMGLKDIRDRAFWLSNDLLGAYDRIGVAGQAIRQHLIPFWSWQEVNMKRYLQLYKNAANDGELASTIGRKLGAATPLAAVKVGQLVLKASGFAAALQVYNHTMFPEEEKTLPESVRSRPHIILGKDKEGKTQYFSRIGILGDALSWFGVDGVQKELRQYLNGHKTLGQFAKDAAKEMAMGPLNVVQSGALPFAKVALETMLRRTTYPDISRPGTVRDRGEHVARSFGLENEYKAIAGKPSKGYGESVKNVFLYSIDPLEAAYRDTFDMKQSFMKRIGKTTEGFWLTPSGDALYNMKLALKYQDKKAFEKYGTEYAKLGGTKEGLMSSIRNMHPLSGMNQNMQVAFLESLSPAEQEKVKGAIKFYQTTLLGNPVNQEQKSSNEFAEFLPR